MPREMQSRVRLQSFRELVAWRKSMDLTEQVYLWTRLLPSGERFGLVSQIQRSSASVACNIAEGWANGTTAMFIRRLRDARGSLAELETQIELVVRVHQKEPPPRLASLLLESARLVQALTASLERKLARESARPAE